MRLSVCLFQFSFAPVLAQPQTSYNSYTSLLPQSSCYRAYFVHFGMCPLNVIIGKISVFLSTDSQSTGSLTLKSHVPVFALLSPFIAVAVIKWNSSLQVSATWSVHFVGNESCNVHIKNYSIIWLGMGQTLAQGPPNPRWRQTNPQTPQSR